MTEEKVIEIIEIDKEVEKCRTCKSTFENLCYSVPVGDGAESMLVCPKCYSYFKMTKEEKQEFLKSEREKERLQNRKVCGTCKQQKDNVKTLALTDGQGVQICTDCIDRIPLTATERLAMQLNEMLVKSATEEQV